MPTTRWNRRRVIIFSICLVIVYWIFSASRNTYTSGVTIRNTKPEVAWEYVADFQKMRSLNPTMYVWRMDIEYICRMVFNVYYKIDWTSK